MTARPHRGGTPVGQLSDLGAVEVGAVLCLRLWDDDPVTRARIGADLMSALGPQQGQAALDTFTALCDLCAQHGRRPLMRHHVACQCLGADESCFATFIGYASEGATDDALLMAIMLVNPGVAPVLAGLARDFGLALRRMALRSPAWRSPDSPVH